MDDFVPFEIAEKLRKKGFNEKTFGFYLFPIKLPQYPITYITKNYNKKDNFYSAPTISQVLKWLREEKRIDAGAVWDNRGDKWVGYVTEMDMPDLVGRYILPNTYDSYELAAIAAIEYVIDNHLIKENC